MPRRRSLALLAIVAVALGVRLTYTFTSGHGQRLTWVEGQIAHNLVSDGRWFDRNAAADRYEQALTARRLQLVDPASVSYTRFDRAGQWRPEAEQSIGEAAVLAGLWSVTGGQRYWQIQVLQAVVDALAALLVYWIAWQLFRRVRPALIAAGLYALYPPIAWTTVNPYDDIWAVDFTIAIVALYLLVLRSGHRWRWLIACGLCAGIGAYFRPQVLLIAPALALATIAATGWREALRRSFTTTAIASLLLVPWTIRNYEDFHAFIPTRAGLWQTMWAGLNELSNSLTGSLSEEALRIDIHRVHPNLLPETPAWDAYAKPYVIHAIERHPLLYVEVLAHRVALATIWPQSELWMRSGTELVVFSHKGGALGFVIDEPFHALEYALEPLVFLLAILGLVLTWRYGRLQQGILVAVVLCVLVPYLAIHVEGRYLLPAAFVYFVWIGLGAELVCERLALRLRGARAGAPRRALSAQ
jgi:4-amino-4-deoxy-L-arabinose transferase-like glycosyltransferase